MSQFSSTGSVTNTDMNNNSRGYYRDNADHAVTGTTNETTLGSFTLTANDLGATGTLIVYAAGTITNSASAQKLVKLYFGATAIATVTRTAANAQDWFIWAKISNTSTSAQRIEVWFSTTDATTCSFDYITAAIDTTANVTVAVKGTLTNGADTATETKLEALNAQIT